VTRAIAAEVLELRREVARHIDAGSLRAASRPSARLIELTPDSGWALALRALVVRGVDGLAAARAVASDALVHGVEPWPLLLRLGELFDDAADDAAASLAKASASVLGAPSMGSSHAARRRALLELQDFVAAIPSPSTVSELTRGLAMARTGLFEGAAACLAAHPDISGVGEVDLTLTRGLIACKLGHQQEAEAIWARSGAASPEHATDGLRQLLDAHASRSDVKATGLALMEIQSQVPAPRALDITRAVGAVMLCVGGDRAVARAAVAKIDPTRRHLAIVRLALAATTIDTDVLEATSHAIAATEWDETGDTSLPWGEAVSEQILEKLNAPPRSLAAAQGVHALNRGRARALSTSPA
jgi:hypothetical protein